MQIKKVTHFPHFLKFCDMRKKTQIYGIYMYVYNELQVRECMYSTSFPKCTRLYVHLCVY